MGKMCFVGVGPGDPALLTLGAVRAIREATCIAVADSGTGVCAALEIAKEWTAHKPVLHLAMPMRGASPDWREAQDRAAETLRSRLDAGDAVAYLVLGDPSLYASSGYLLRRLATGPHPCEVVAGVPAICAAAARLGVPLAEGREPLTLLAGYAEGTPIPDGNVVILKAGKRLDALRSALGSRPAYLAQNVGMPGEVLGRLQDVGADDEGSPPSYFTTVLIKPRDDGEHT